MPNNLDWENDLQNFGDLFAMVQAGAIDALALDRAQKVLNDLLTPERIQKIQTVISSRSRGVVPVLENIYDRGNTSAVMRSSEAFGFFEFYVVESPDAKFKAANRVTKGTEKWLNVQKFKDTRGCVESLRSKGYQILITRMENATAIDAVDFSKPTALVFGNEKDGVSAEMSAAADGAVIIPMFGFAQSFNISVAAALCLHHAHHVRTKKGITVGALDSLESRCLMIEYMLQSSESARKILNSRG